MSALSEKRRFPRMPLRTPLEYQVRGAAESDRTITEDISVGGLCFAKNGFIRPQTPVSLKVNLLSRILNPIGRIAWSFPEPHSDKYRVGVEFLEMDYTEKKLLSDFINLQASVI
jgi:hypothetical protein